MMMMVIGDGGDSVMMVISGVARILVRGRP